VSSASTRWRSVTAAVISRAAGQLSRHATYLRTTLRVSHEGNDILGIPKDARVPKPDAVVHWRSNSVDDNGDLECSGEGDPEEVQNVDVTPPSRCSGSRGDLAGKKSKLEEPQEAAGGIQSEPGEFDGRGRSFWATTPNAAMGLAPWPWDFLAQQGPAPVVPLSIHAVGRPRLNIQAALGERVNCVQLRAAQAWGVGPAEFLLALTGVLLDPSAPLVHYLNRGAILEAVAPGPR